MQTDDQTRTPPHGDALTAAGASLDAAINRQTRKVAVEIAKRTPVGVAPIYRALLYHSAEEVEAAIAAAASAGVDPSSFPVYLPDRARWAATDRAMAGPEIPENECGMPIMVKNCQCVPVPVPRRLPSHIERAARRTYTVGYQDGAAGLGHVGRSGVDAFRESLERDAEAALAAQPDTAPKEG